MKKIKALIIVLLLSLGLSLVSFSQRALAIAHSCIWTGGGSDSNLSTAANWSNCNSAAPVPGNGDDLIFPYGTGVPSNRKAPVDDFADGSSFTSIVFSGTSNGSEANYTLSSQSGHSIDVSSGLSITTTGSVVSPTISANLTLSADQTINAGGNTLTLSGVIAGSGNLTKAGAGTVELDGTNTFTGTLDVTRGTLIAGTSSALGDTSAGTTVEDDGSGHGADIQFKTCGNSMTVDEPLTLIGDSSNTAGDFPTPKLETSANNCSGGSGSFSESYGYNANNNSVVLNGDITLGSDITFASFSKTTLNGSLNGSFAINPLAGFAGSLVVSSSNNSSNTSNGTYMPPTFTKTLSDSQPSNTINIMGDSAITVTGTRGDTTVNGGTLKGTGTVGTISLVAGNVAPGMSPGILNSGNLVFTGGNYQAELGGTTSGQYDQINVIGTVNLGTATGLDVSLYGGFKPAKGNSFTIINNDGSDAVTGNFSGLPEGATFTSDGYVYKITYKGGDGNDVVITVQAIPSPPNTGFALIKSNPIITLMSTILATGILVFIARRYKTASSH